MTIPSNIMLHYRYVNESKKDGVVWYKEQIMTILMKNSENNTLIGIDANNVKLQAVDEIVIDDEICVFSISSPIVLRIEMPTDTCYVIYNSVDEVNEIIFSAMSRKTCFLDFTQKPDLTFLNPSYNDSKKIIYALQKSHYEYTC